MDAVLTSNDSVANGIIDALSKNYKGDFPVLTGQNCDIHSVKDILKADNQCPFLKIPAF